MGEVVALEWHTEKRKIKELVPLEKNPFRKINVKNKKRLESKIKRLGIFELPTIDRNNELLSFNKRRHVLMALERGNEEIDVLVPNRELRDDERKEIILTSNIHEGEWDTLILEEDFSDVDFDDVGLDLEALGLDDVITLLPEEEGDDSGQKIKIAESGDLFELISVSKGLVHRVQCGDSTSPDDVGRLYNGKKPILMVTDPPYGVNYDAEWRNEVDRPNGTPYGARAVGRVANDQSQDWSDAYVLFYGDVAYVWNSDKFYHMTAKNLEDCGFEIVYQIIWVKDQGILGRGDYHIQHEPLVCAIRKGKPHNYQGDRTQTTVWQIAKSTRSETGHSTQKPLECMARPIRNNSTKGDIVYDPFLGSGTTLIACESHKRHCYGNEIFAGYVDIIVNRWVRYMIDNDLPYQIKRNGEVLDIEKMMVENE